MDSEKKGFKKLTDPDQALKLFMDNVNISPRGIELVDIRDALNRVLSEDIISPTDSPPFNRAAMDGYAVRSVDVSGASETNPIRLRVIGESKTGEPFKGVVREGEAVRIDTGAEMPEGADAVVMVEYTRRSGDYIDVYRAVAPYQNVSLKGEDVRKGDMVAYAGIPLTPFDLAAIASLGIRKVKVYSRPRIAIASVGNELVEIGSDLGEGQIVETNRLMIKGMISEYPIKIVDYGILKDEVNDLRNFFLDAVDKSDLIIAMGGTSMGKGDLVAKVLMEIGNIIVHGVALYPARPVILASIKGKPVIGLPGYPVAAAIAMHVFGRPIVESLCGISGYRIDSRFKGVLSRRAPSRLGLRHYARGRLKFKDGKIIIEPVAMGGAGVLTSLSLADGYIIVPEDREGYEAGEEAELILYRRYVRG